MGIARPLAGSFAMLTVTLLLTGAGFAGSPEPARSDRRDGGDAHHSSPVDLVLLPGGRAATVLQAAGAAALVDLERGQVLDRVSIGRRPHSIAATADGRQLVATAGYGGEVHLLEVDGRRLRAASSLNLGFEPQGVAITSDGSTAFVALAAAGQVAVIRMQGFEVIDRIDVGRWPTHVTLTADDARLAVAVNGDGGISVVDVASGRLRFTEQFRGMNFGKLLTSGDGSHVYFPWSFYGENATTPSNIRRGWVMASRLGRVDLRQPGDRKGLSLDPPGQAVSDPYGLDRTDDGRYFVLSSSGTHELLVLRREGLPMAAIGGGAHMPKALREDKSRFFRIPVGGRPMGLQIAGDNRTVYVANYLQDALQVVDLEERKLTKTIPLGDRPSALTSARRGEILFYDAKRSLDGWYSCHTCHQHGGGNLQIIDTLNDGTMYTYKTVLPLYNLKQTGPWTWHGWQEDLHAAMAKSLTTTMRGPEPSPEDVDDLLSFLATLELPPNPHRAEDGALSAAAKRGREVFHTIGCAECHSGPYYTDGQQHDVGLGSSDDRYPGYDTPSLIGVYRKPSLLHDGRAKSLEDLLSGPHDPSKVLGSDPLTDAERRDLVAFLKSL